MPTTANQETKALCSERYVVSHSVVKRPFAAVGTLVALVAGCAFLYVATSVALRGTGAAIPEGEHVVEGELIEAASVRVPAGPPILYGEVKVTDPGASRAVDHHWRTPVGSAELKVHTPEGERLLQVPAPAAWKGVVHEATMQTDSLQALPVVGDHPEIAERQGPPYLIIIRGVRAGDSVVAELESASSAVVTELHVGDRATLRSALAQREAMRWPMVILMALVGMSSLGVAAFAFRRSRGTAAREDATQPVSSAADSR